MKELKIWYVEFPTYQYNENVKELAVQGGFKIVDAKFQGENKQALKVPKLTSINAKLNKED